MTGPEHYQEAERLLNSIEENKTMLDTVIDLTAKIAQVHATLALAAATVSSLDLVANHDAWTRAIR